MKQPVYMTVPDKSWNAPALHSWVRLTGDGINNPDQGTGRVVGYLANHNGVGDITGFTLIVNTSYRDGLRLMPGEYE